MTSDSTMGTTHHRWRTIIWRAALSMITTVAVNAVHAESGQPPAVTDCDNSLPDRAVSNCKGDDDLGDRPKQLETMNQQLRMERRRKDSLLHLYPDEATHNAARLHALEEKERPIRVAEDRIEDLTRERRRLGEATGFYAGKRLPSDLKIHSQHIDVALQEATATLRNCRDERVLVSKNYDDELIVLRKLWAAQRKI